jgi:prevent-host-death family protein
MTSRVSLYEAKTHLSALVERASAGEEVVITKNGAPRARLVPLPPSEGVREPAGALKLTSLADDFDALSPEIEAMFSGT